MAIWEEIEDLAVNFEACYKTLSAIGDETRQHKKRCNFSFGTKEYHISEKFLEYHEMDGKDMPAKDELSERISADLKKRGFKFVGPTTVYSYLQGIGIINDHWEYCDYR